MAGKQQFGRKFLAILLKGFLGAEERDSLTLMIRVEGWAVKPRERRDRGEQDLFRSRLDQIIDMSHELVKLARAIDWRFLEGRFGEAYSDGPGMPPLPTRLMAGLAILKHTFNLSDEELCSRWIENPYFQYLWGKSSSAMSCRLIAPRSPAGVSAWAKRRSSHCFRKASLSR